MLAFLIGVGRLAVVIAALLTMAAAAAAGWMWGAGRPAAEFGLTQTADTTPNQILFAALGFVGGLAAAGLVFGLAAAVLDMQRSLRLLARREIEYGSGGEWQDRSMIEQAGVEQAGGRTEPRLTSASD